MILIFCATGALTMFGVLGVMYLLAFAALVALTCIILWSAIRHRQIGWIAVLLMFGIVVALIGGLSIWGLSQH